VSSDEQFTNLRRRDTSKKVLALAVAGAIISAVSREPCVHGVSGRCRDAAIVRKSCRSVASSSSGC